MPHLFSLLAAFLAIAVGMGVLSAGLLMPAVGAGGAAAKSTVEAFEDLPANFSITPLAQQSKIVDAKGKTIATPYDENRIIVKLDQIAPIMQKAQIAIEDSRFYEHGGLDLRGTMRALVNNLEGGTTQGGSSLTQQYVKMSLQEKALKSGNEAAAKAAVASTGIEGYARKLQELKYALNLEKTLTKKQILQGYLNLVYYGDLAYGVEAAALHYFGVHAKDLNLSQAATLAGTVRAPGTTDPHNFPKQAQQRRNLVIDRMLQLGWISKKQATKAKKPSVKSMLNLSDNQGGTCTRSAEPYFCTYVMAYLKQMPELGKNVDERVQNINTGGLRIKTTLNRKWQVKVRRMLTKKVPAGDRSQVGAGATVVEPGTGKILAMAQTSQYDPTIKKSTVARTSQNWNVPQAYGGTQGFQYGSTAKVYAMVRALQDGIPVNGTVPSKYATTTKAAVYQPSEFKSSCGRPNEPFEVRNDFSVGGEPLPLKEAIADSINSAFASLIVDVVGVCPVQKTTTQMGLRSGTGEEIVPGASNMIFGSDTTTTLQIAESYATIAADGKYCPPNPIESITTPDGKKLKIKPPKCKQAIDKDVARGAAQLLKGVIDHGTGTGAQLADGRVAAGKTGTTDKYQQSWFVGFTPQLSTAVYVGTPLEQRSMKNITIGGQFYSRVFGGTIAAPLWKEIMDMASAGMPKKDFSSPSDKIENGDLVTIPNVTGRSVQEALSILKDADLNGTVAGNVNSSIPQGLVASTNPTGQALRGTTIGLYVSTGYVPPTTTSRPPDRPTSSPTRTPPNQTTTPPRPSGRGGGPG
jgi:membrane peptidoglycan carboxypeptidase